MSYRHQTPVFHPLESTAYLMERVQWLGFCVEARESWLILCVGTGCHAGPWLRIRTHIQNPAAREGAAALPYAEILYQSPIWKIILKMSA
jgi:hypothetical protein